MSKRRSEYQIPVQNEETIKKMEIQKRAINLSEMPYVVLREILKNVHPKSATKMMRANKPWNAFVTRNRRLWRKSIMDARVDFERLPDGRVEFTIELNRYSENRQHIIKIQEAKSGTPITPDEDIFIQKELKANVADPMGQLLKIMEILTKGVNINNLVLERMPEEATIAITSIFDKNKTIIEDIHISYDSRCPSTLQKFVRSLYGTKRISLSGSSKAVTADLLKLPQIQNAHRLFILPWPDYLPLGDADLLALKTKYLRFRSHSDITQRYFRTIVQEFMSFKRDSEGNNGCNIYYEGILEPEQVFDGFHYHVLEHNPLGNEFKYKVTRSDNRKLIVHFLQRTLFIGTE